MHQSDGYQRGASIQLVPRPRLFFIAALSCWTLAFLWCPPASGQDALLPSTEIAQRLEWQQAEIEALHARLWEIEAAAQPPLIEPLPPAETPSSELTSVLNRLDAIENDLKAKVRTASESSGDKQEIKLGNWSLKPNGHVQGDYVNWAHSDPAIVDAHDYFEFRRIRMNMDGTDGLYDFRVQLEFEPESDGDSGITAPHISIRDIYLGIHEIPYLGYVRFGNAFMPFSIEQLTDAPAFTFMERSIPTQGVFSPAREVGVTSFNISESKNFTYSFGVYFDSISEGLKERVDDNQGTRVAGRVTWLPYYDEPSDGRYLVHVGAGFILTDDQDGQVRFRTRPHIHEGPSIIDTGTIAASTYSIENVELLTVWGAFSVQSELYAAQVDDYHFYGSYLYGSYFLTGEHRKYGRTARHLAHFNRVVPFTPFFMAPRGNGWGAWEAKARWAYLDFGEINRGQYNDLTVGINWYWTERARMMFEWIRPRTTADTTFGETQSDILATRMEFSY